MTLSPFVLVLLSAILWAMQPTFILVMGQRAIDQSNILVLNTLATAFIAFAYGYYKGALGPLMRSLREQALLARYFGTIALDGLLISLAYYFLFKSANSANLASPALFFEAWPIVTLLFLFFRSPKALDRTNVVFLASMLFFIGFVIINLSENGGQGLAFSPGLLFSLLSALFFGIGVAVIQLLVRGVPELSQLANFSVTIFFRALMTSIFLFALSELTESGVRPNSWGPGEFAISLAFGGFVFLNTVFYHIGMFRAKTNSVGMIVLISPVLAPVFIFLLGLGAPHLVFFVGAAFIFAGVSVTSRSEDNTVQFQILVLLILIAGSAVVFLDGAGDKDYFDYVQVIFIFYGLLQVALLSRSHDKFVALTDQVLEYKTLIEQRDRAGARLLASKIRFRRSESSSLSELVLLSVVAVGGTIVSILSRENSLTGDAVAFLIAVSVAFLALLCWYYQLRIMMMKLSNVRLEGYRARFEVRGRLLSYLVSVSLFAWFLGLIVFKHASSLPMWMPLSAGPH